MLLPRIFLPVSPPLHCAKQLRPCQRCERSDPQRKESCTFKQTAQTCSSQKWLKTITASWGIAPCTHCFIQVHVHAPARTHILLYWRGVCFWVSLVLYCCDQAVGNRFNIGKYLWAPWGYELFTTFMMLWLRVHAYFSFVHAQHPRTTHPHITLIFFNLLMWALRGLTDVSRRTFFSTGGRPSYTYSLYLRSSSSAEISITTKACIATHSSIA